MTPSADDVVACYPMALAAARRLLPQLQDVEDVVQTAMLHAVRGLSAFKGQCKLSTWVVGIVLSVVLTERRRRRRKPVSQTLDLEGRPVVETIAAAERPDALVAREEAAEVRATLSRMSRAHAQALQIAYLEDGDAETVARAQGRSRGAAYSLLYQARREFRRRYRASQAA